MRREHKQKQVLHDIKAIFLDSFILPATNKDKIVLEKLVNIVDKVNQGHFLNPKNLQDRLEIVSKCLDLFLRPSSKIGIIISPWSTMVKGIEMT